MKLPDFVRRRDYVEKEPASTFDESIIRPGRRVGNTARQVDRAIQLIFEGKGVFVFDHARMNEAHRCQLDWILTRLSQEHGMSWENKGWYINGREIVFCKRTFLIEFFK